MGIQAVVAQGCRGVGNAYEVTKGQGNFIEELDHRPAVEVLGEISEGTDISEEDKKKVEKQEIDRLLTKKF